MATLEILWKNWFVRGAGGLAAAWSWWRYTEILSGKGILPTASEWPRLVAEVAPAWVAFSVVWLLAWTASRRKAPGVWASLAATSGKGRWHYYVNRGGDATHLDAVKRVGRTPARPDNEEPSLAMSPDGLLLATVAGGVLRIWTVNSSTGKINRWRDDICLSLPIPTWQPEFVRLLAVERNGPTSVRLCLAYNYKTMLASCHGTSVEDVNVFSSDHACLFACFLGARLLYGLKVGEQTNGHARGAKPRLDPGAKLKMLTARGEETFREELNGRVLGLDAAEINDRRCVALLVRNAGNQTRHIASWWEDDVKNQATVRVGSAVSQIHIMRARRAARGEKDLCILVSDGRKVRPVFPYRRRLLGFLS